MLNFIEIGRTVVVMRERKGLTQEKLALEAEIERDLSAQDRARPCKPYASRPGSGGGHTGNGALHTSAALRRRTEISGRIAGALRW